MPAEPPVGSDRTKHRCNLDQPIAPANSKPSPTRFSPTTAPGRAPCTIWGATSCPSKQRSRRCVETIRALLLPGFVGVALVGATSDDLRAFLLEKLGELRGGLKRQVYRGLHHRCELPLDNVTARCARCSELSEGITSRFLVALPELRASLATDVEAAYDGRSGGDRYRRGHFLLPRPLRDRVLPHGEPVASRGGQHHPAHDHRARPREDGHRHSPRRDHRQIVLHRSRHRHRDRRDGDHRRPGAHLTRASPWARSRFPKERRATPSRRSGTRPSKTT